MSLAEVLSHVDQSELVALPRDLIRIPSVVKAARIYAASALNFLGAT